MSEARFLTHRHSETPLPHADVGDFPGSCAFVKWAYGDFPISLFKVYKGEDASFQISGLQSNADYRFRVCVCRRCLDTSQELSGAFSPSAAFVLQRNEMMLAGETGCFDDPKRKSPMPTDGQFAALIVLGFAGLSVLFAFILQYFLMK